MREMNMIHNMLFKAGFTLKDRSFLKCYRFLKESDFKTYEQLKAYQDKSLEKLVKFSYSHVPYYREIFDNLGLDPKCIKSTEDLEVLPILTKDIIRSDPKKFIPDNLGSQKFSSVCTGGSTGNPLQYRMSKRDETLGLALLYVKFGYAGYELGDKIGVIAGSSLVPSTKPNIKDNLKAFVLNEKRFSGFSLDDEYLEEIINAFNKFKPKYIRGYASSLYLFANYILNSGAKIDFKPQGAFSTVEVLFDHQRKIIEEALNCRVFDQYGMNDGGLNASECEVHKGFHIDMARSILEVADDRGVPQGPGNEGHILATSLNNYAMPFIRYDTGDLGILSSHSCECGRGLPLLNKIIGRSGDLIATPSGAKIHAAFFCNIFWQIPWAKQFQVVQKRNDQMTIKIIPDNKDSVNQSDLQKIEKIVLSRTGPMEITFDITETIELTPAGKWKLTVREA
jgi:phenylacetate-CoA ligase